MRKRYILLFFSVLLLAISLTSFSKSEAEINTEKNSSLNNNYSQKKTLDNNNYSQKKTLDVFIENYKNNQNIYGDPDNYLNQIYPNIPDSYVVTAVEDNDDYSFFVREDDSEPEIFDANGNKIKVETLESTTLGEIRQSLSEI